jgi:cation diffusion facilitator CzcD-associated flavoprotein CzcO
VVPKIDLRFGPLAKKLFARIPATQRVLRWFTDSVYEVMVSIGVVHFKTFRGRGNISAADLSKLHRFITIRDKDLRRRLTPDYDFGCKRPTFSNGYYRAFTRENVHLQDAGIDHVQSDGIVGKDGTKVEIDTLVLATGFDLWEANFPAIEVIGRDGRNLGKWWRETRFQAYQGVSMPYFPNYLSLASPYAFLGLNFFNTMEYQMRLMDRLFDELQRRGATTFEVSEEANTRYLDRMTELLGDSLFTQGNCASARSYYYNPAGEPTLLRPTTTETAIREASEFPLSDYILN